MAGVAKMRSVVLDCPDTQLLATFYRDLLGWEIVYSAGDEEEDAWVTLSDGGPIRLCFQRVAGYRPPRWPDQDHPQQAHLDVTVEDLDAAEQLTLALGATKADVQRSEDGTFRTFLDPAGHPFCLCID
jgi:catechol 2,3-dioxygenase-like lactoylglutathione lyase family enzyme